MYKAIRDWLFEPPKTEDEFDSIMRRGEVAVTKSMKKARRARQAYAQMSGCVYAVELPEERKAVLVGLLDEAKNVQIEEMEIDRFVESIDLPEDRKVILREYLSTYLNSSREYTDRMVDSLRREDSSVSYSVLDFTGAAIGLGAGAYFENILAIFAGGLIGYIAPGGIRRARRYLSEQRDHSERIEQPRNFVLETLRQ